jgi:hypothetical protein
VEVSEVDRIKQRREAALKFKRVCASRLSLTSPRFNFREIAKQMLLLEDHLLHANKHCPDCIRKHLLTIEAFAEEATSLDGNREYGDAGEVLAEGARRWMERVADGDDLAAVAQDIRRVRKHIVPHVFDPRARTASDVALLWWHRNNHQH